MKRKCFTDQDSDWTLAFERGKDGYWFALMEMTIVDIVNAWSLSTERPIMIGMDQGGIDNNPGAGENKTWTVPAKRTCICNGTVSGRT